MTDVYATGTDSGTETDSGNETETETVTGATTTTGAVQRLAERWIRDGMAAGEDRDGTGTGTDTGFVCSPAGLWLALAAVAAGARGATAAELRALLGTAAVSYTHL